EVEFRVARLYTVVVDTATTPSSRVGAEGAVVYAQPRRAAIAPAVVDTAAVHGGRVAAHSAVADRQRAHLLRQISQQVGGIADAQFFDVTWAIGVHRIQSRLFCGGNIRASDDDTLPFPCRACCCLSGKFGSDQQANADSNNEDYLACCRSAYASFHLQL